MIYLSNRFGIRRSTFIAFITFISVSICLSLFSVKYELLGTKNENKIAIDHTNVPNCFANTVLAKPSSGRLGNRLMEYASAWSLAQMFNLTLLIADSTNDYIRPLFSHLSAIPVSKFINDLGERNSECRNLTESFLLERSNTPINETDPMNQKIEKWMSTGPILLRPFIVLSSTIAVFQSTMKNKFNYRREFSSYAHKKLKKAAASLKNKIKNEQVVYVGVHVRRTDYPMYLQRKVGMNVAIADVNYYVRAMEYMLKKLRDERYFKVVFSVVSDDKSWSTTTLIPPLKSFLRKRNLDKNVSVIWNGSNDFRNDLVLLSACNHSIIAYGTYGSWGALMAGGITVVFDIHRNERQGRYINMAMSFAKHLPNWTVM